MLYPMKRKVCTTCNENKPVDHFDQDVRYRSGYRSQCKECRLITLRRASLASHLKRAYGATIEWYDQKLEEQGGVCAICKQKETRRSRPVTQAGVRSLKVTRLSVDHDHDTGELRGLLCQRCNIAIGHLMDDLEYLKNAIAYIEKYR